MNFLMKVIVIYVVGVGMIKIILWIILIIEVVF